MMHAQIRRLGAASMVGLYLFASSAALAAATCGSSPISAVSVIGDYKIDFSQGNNDCKGKILFYNSPSVAANTGKLNQAAVMNPGQELCKSIDTGVAADTGVAIKESGTAAAARPVIPFVATTSSFWVTTSNGDQLNTSLAWNVSVAKNTTELQKLPALLTPNGQGWGQRVKVTDNLYTVTLPGGDYGDITVENGNKLVFTGPVRLGKLSCANSAGSVTFAAGQNYIRELSHTAGCGIFVGPDANADNPAVLNINGTNSSGNVVGLNMYGGPTCVNYVPAAGGSCTSGQDVATMGSQSSNNLEINVLNGNLTVANAEAWAANVYVQNGGAKIDTGPFTLVGSITAKGDVNIQPNEESKFYFKAKPGGSVDKSAYSLAPPAVEKTSQTGSIIYRTMQADYQADGSLGTSGHLKAFKLKSDSTQEAAPLWDAADRQTVTNRNEKIRTQVAGSFGGAASDFELLSTTAAAAFTGTVGVETLTSSAAQILDPTNAVYAAKLGGRDKTALLGTPWRTNPIIVGKSVLFATDDGILYSVKAGELADGGGALNWGWIPRQLLPHTAKYADLALKHPWGQIAAIAQTVQDASGNYVTETYVVGTAMGGQVHFSIKVSADGDVLQGVSWLDDSAGKFSPGSASLAGDTAGVKAMSANWQGIVGGPSGGAAPTPAAADSSGDPLKVAYVYGDSTAGVELMVRRLDGKDSSVPTSVKFKTANGGLAVLPAAAAPVVKVSSNLLYVTDDAIYFGTSSGRVERSDTTGQLVASPGDKDLLVTDAILNVNGAPVASGNGSGVVLTAQTARRLTVLKYVGGTWTVPVWWTGLSASGDAESSGENVPKIVTGAGYTTKITAAPDIVNGKVIMYVTKTKVIDSCTTETKGYAFGPMDLLTGEGAAAGSTFKVTENIADNLMNLIGDGQAVGGSGTIFNGKTGVLTGSSKDTGLLAPGAGQIKQRLNWRELTNFF